jgi:hypothetical protein
MSLKILFILTHNKKNSKKHKEESLLFSEHKIEIGKKLNEP